MPYYPSSYATGYASDNEDQGYQRPRRFAGISPSLALRQQAIQSQQEARQFSENARSMEIALNVRKYQAQEELRLSKMAKEAQMLSAGAKLAALDPNSPLFPKELKMAVTKDPDIAALYFSDKEWKKAYVDPLVEKHDNIVQGINSSLERDGVPRTAYDYVNEDGAFNWNAISEDRMTGQARKAEAASKAREIAMQKGQQAVAAGAVRATEKTSPDETLVFETTPEERISQKVAETKAVSEERARQARQISPAREFAQEGYRMPLGDVLSAQEPKKKKGFFGTSEETENAIYKIRVNDAGEQDPSGEFYKVVDKRGTTDITHTIPVADLEDYATRLKQYNAERGSKMEAKKPETPSTEPTTSDTTEKPMEKTPIQSFYSKPTADVTTEQSTKEEV